LHHGIGRERRKIGGGFENLRGRRGTRKEAFIPVESRRRGKKISK
jgi:hypothetical protein